MPDDNMTLIDFRPDESEPDDHPADAGASQSPQPDRQPDRSAIPWVLVVIFLGLAVLAGGLLLSTTPLV